MSTELQQPVESEAGQNDFRIPEVDDAIASDEAMWKQQGREGLGAEDPQRDEQGRFASADQAARAGQAKPDEEAEGKESSGDNERSEKQQEQQEPEARSQKPEAKAKPEQDGEGKPGDRAGDAGKPDNRSAYVKEQERKAKSWESINASKKEIEGQREQLKLERESFEAQQKTVTATARDPKGFSAADYENAGAQYQQRGSALMAASMEAEAGGDYAKADSLREQAERQNGLAGEATKRATALRGQAGGSAWSKLAADLPEALQFGGEVNTAIRQLLKSNPALLGDPSGPFRAAVQVGRKVLQATTAERDQFKAEAARVPELQKQIADLSSKVQELNRLTSLPGAGGGAMSRSAGGEKPFEDMTLEEMEADLKRQAAA